MKYSYFIYFSFLDNKSQSLKEGRCSIKRDEKISSIDQVIEIEDSLKVGLKVDTVFVKNYIFLRKEWSWRVKLKNWWRKRRELQPSPAS